LWNASAASGVTEKDYCAPFDSVSVCFSKGLGAPVGSVLAGNREFIEKARRFRKMFGGGMRQAGIIAAGALYALQHHRNRLIHDHANARRLAEGLAKIPGLHINPADVETNMVRFGTGETPAPVLVAKLQEQGILTLPVGLFTIRAVTNLMCDANDIARAVEVAEKAMKQLGA
jgi:threonine aldolase